ncbi:uncharacterized protein LOC129240673 isoform X1 [Anastrepha obliqua]|uniref:uncharacterized protein LOC129240673 isoform X1 n=2 Tax=Anastrepha obliqua TaxID=95512 RepID=UPI00240A4915|nr:uncharacterized protein LOC129240673 isoform X1 [Anastrepha obliqua]
MLPQLLKLLRTQHFSTHLHIVTCPGVWLCTHGYLEVTIKTLGYFFRTGAMEPRFPLLCHDKFTMDGYFKSVGSLSDLERVLTSEQVEITLWQNGRRMAYFLGKLADIMHADTPKLTCEHNIDVQLLMKATPAFPGIIAPKVELSARVGVQDRLPRSEECNRYTNKNGSNNLSLCKLEFEAARAPNRHSLQPNSAAETCFRYLEERRYQRPVCHTKTSCGSGFTKENSAAPCFHATKSFEMDANTCKQFERRLSTGSSTFSNSSYNLSQITRLSSPSRRSQSICTVSSISTPDEHQRQCSICQSYRKVFS